MRILAVDPGTFAGFAYTDTARVEPTSSGVWNLEPRRGEGWGRRFTRLREYLDGVAPDRLVWEDVRGHKGTEAAHLYGGYVATLLTWCEDHGAPYSSLPVWKIKQVATGKGNANKAAMIHAAARRWGDVTSGDRADALWILEAYLREKAGL